MRFDEKIYIAGHLGMVGSAIVKNLLKKGFSNIITKDKNELDLTKQELVYNFLKTEKPDYVIVAAAKVGGIYANNNYPADFIYQNLMIEVNLIHGAYLAGIQNLLFLGSSCIYPKDCLQPIKEEYLLSAFLEPTNEPYAISKIAGIKLCESYNRQYSTDYRSIMPTNLYGPNDNFNLLNSHVVPALVRKFHEAKIKNLPYTEVWGSGLQMRDFLHVDDLAEAVLHVMSIDKHVINKVTDPMLSHINVGSDKEISISDCALIIKKIIGYEGDIIFDTKKPDGTYRKILEISKIKKLGWAPKIKFEVGIEQTYNWFLTNEIKK